MIRGGDTNVSCPITEIGGIEEETGDADTGAQWELLIRERVDFFFYRVLTIRR